MRALHPCRYPINVPVRDQWIAPASERHPGVMALQSGALHHPASRENNVTFG
jgi:hypothetical protein